MEEVVLLSSSRCSYCDVMKDRLNRMGIKFREVKIESDEGKRMVREHGIKGLPATIINKKGKKSILIGLVPENELIKEVRQ